MSMTRTRLATVAGALFVVVGLIPIGLRAARSQTPASRGAQPAATHLTTPMEEWGHNIGDDYFLVDYQQLIKYWHKLEQQSPRVHIVDIGKSSEGRPMLMAVITSPENYKKIDRYK